jgi:hypothetical protein
MFRKENRENKMNQAFINKWVFEKRTQFVSRYDFLKAIDVANTEIQKATSTIPQVKLSFYKSSGDPNNKELRVTKEMDNPQRIPFFTWHQAQSIKAWFSTTANGNIPPIKMLIEPRKPDQLGITFEITKCEIGDKIARAILNDNPGFKMWLRSDRSMR